MQVNPAKKAAQCAAAVKKLLKAIEKEYGRDFYDGELEPRVLVDRIFFGDGREELRMLSLRRLLENEGALCEDPAARRLATRIMNVMKATVVGPGDLHRQRNDNHRANEGRLAAGLRSQST